MIVIRNQISIFNLLFFLTFRLAYSEFVTDILISKLIPDASKNDPLLVTRVPRDTSQLLQKPENLDASESSKKDIAKVIRKARDSKYYSENYGSNSKNVGRSLKPEDNLEDNRDVKGTNPLGKRCTTCDSGYLGSSYYRGRDRYDRDPYSKYDRYDRYDRDRYDRYDDYDRDDYRGRNRYSSSYDKYDPRDRYYDRGVGYDNRGYNYRDYYRDDYSPYYRDRYDPYDDYYSRGYDSISRGGGGRGGGGSGGGYYSSRPDYYGGYAKGYSYGDRDRYGGYGSGSGSGSGYGNGYGNNYGGYGSGYGTSGYGSYSGSRSRYPYDYDTGYRSTSYLYDRAPSTTTTDMPKNSDGESHTVSPSQSSSPGRNN